MLRPSRGRQRSSPVPPTVTSSSEGHFDWLMAKFQTLDDDEEFVLIET